MFAHPLLVGNCDGSMNGQRYFTTDHHRGIFCKRNDLEAVTE
jgi:dynactin complex subunit